MGSGIFARYVVLGIPSWGSVQEHMVSGAEGLFSPNQNLFCVSSLSFLMEAINDESDVFEVGSYMSL